MRDINQLLESEDKAVILSFVDRQVTKALQTALAKRPDTSAIASRIHILEDSELKRQADFDLKFHILKKCYQSGLDYTLVEDMPFDSIESANRKMNQLSDFAKLKKSQDANTQLSSGYKPGTGIGNTSRSTAGPMTKNDILEHEQSGDLDSILSQYGLKH